MTTIVKLLPKQDAASQVGIYILRVSCSQTTPRVTLKIIMINAHSNIITLSRIVINALSTHNFLLIVRINNLWQILRQTLTLTEENTVKEEFDVYTTSSKELWSFQNH